MKQFFLFASITMAAGLLVTNIYNSVIDAASWGRNIPASIETARDYYKTVNPGTFYRVYSPLTQVMALIALVFFWSSAPQVRVYLAIALVLYVLGDVFTFAYFYPRNKIMFQTPITEIEKIKQAWSEWNTMNWVRSLVCLAGLIFSYLSLNKIYHLR